MTAFTHSARFDLQTLIALIARSPIIVAPMRRFAKARRAQCMPSGFDDSDIAVLDWIAAEGRRAGRHFVRM